MSNGFLITTFFARRTRRARIAFAAAAMMLGVAMLARPAAAREPKPIPWDPITAEATDLLSQYIRINTTNPPGNEIDAANLLKGKFTADGIPSVIYKPAPGRAVIAARLRGTGKHRKTIVLLSHMDVVPAEAKDWRVDPFSGIVKDGEVWGRGALDDKGPGVAQLMALLAIKRAGILLDRDVLFLATGDEETGGKLGAGWIAEHQRDLLADAGYVLNEGGEIRLESDGHRVYAVAVTEKTPLWIRLTASGPSGHASTPPEQTAVSRLIRALNKLLGYQQPIKIEPVVEREFRRRGALDHRPGGSRDLRKALKDPAFARQFLSVPTQAAMVRNTITPTVIAAGQKTNVIPSTAYAEIDCRLLPSEDALDLLHNIRQTIADDSIRIEEILNFPAAASPEKSDLMTAIQTLASRHDAKAMVIPTMLTGFTDSHYFRQLGLIAYGFTPLEIAPEQERTVHGANERVSISNLRGAIERTAALLRIMGGR